MRIAIVVMVLCGVISAHANRNWQSIEIPGATCSDGSTYKVFLDRKDDAKLAMKLQGGSACWSYFTCFFLEITPRRAPSTVHETEAFVSDDSRRSPVADYSFLYMPYCTGDVHLGEHTADYEGYEFRHNGKANVAVALEYLDAQGIIDFGQVDDVVLYGASAGAIGALYHVTTLAPYVNLARSKRLILDAPGLHFGENFWYKFTEDLFQDYGRAMGELGYAIDRDQGVVAQVVKNVCDALPEWQVGVLQGTRDKVMSTVFGSISERDHEEAIFSPLGIQSLTEDASDNCSAFLPSTRTHVFMQKNQNTGVKADGVSAMDYVKNLIHSGAGKNYHEKNYQDVVFPEAP